MESWEGPERIGGKMGHRSGVGGGLRRKMVVLNYTHLHAFTRFYTLFLTVNVTDPMPLPAFSHLFPPESS